jgi:hypothetical protein
MTSPCRDTADAAGRRPLALTSPPAALLAAALAVLAATPLAGATFTVTSLGDTGAGSLRTAIASANALPGPDVVEFAPGLAGTIALTSGVLEIADPLELRGPGAGVLAVTGGATQPVLRISVPGSSLPPESGPPEDFSVGGLTIRDGAAAIGSGGIEVFGENLVLEGVVLEGHRGTTGSALAVHTVLLPESERPTLALVDTVVRGNTSTNGGGAIGVGAIFPEYLASVTLDRVSVVGNSGGGLRMRSFGALTVRDATFTGNSAGSPIYLSVASSALLERVLVSDNSITSAWGGALEAHEVTLAVRASTFAGNHGARLGGALFCWVCELTVESSTFAGNSALAGGALYLLDTRATVAHSTIAANTADGAAGGMHAQKTSLGFPDAPVVLRHAVVGDNAAPAAPDLQSDTGARYEIAWSLVESTTGATVVDLGGNRFGVDPQLAPLAANGGPTPTMLPLPTSPAINAGDPAFAPPPATDQRGLPRVLAARIDMGAVEVQLAPLDVPVLGLPGAAALTSLLAALGLRRQRRGPPRRR